MLRPMPNPSMPTPPSPGENTADSNESFNDILSQFEKSHQHKAGDGSQRMEGTVVSLTADSVLLDIGYKTEGILPLADFEAAGETVKVGDKLAVSVKGRDPEGYYTLSRFKVARPKDWSSLERAFADKESIIGTVTGVIKGGVSVDVGVRAFMPASRSGAREAGDLEKLVGQEVRVRIIKLDVTEEDVVVDRRVVAEEEASGVKERRYSEVRAGDIVHATVRSLTDYGAFVDMGGVDALLHIGDIAWARINKAGDVLTVGQQVEVKVLRIDPDKHRISVGMKQLQPDPWDTATEKYKVGERVRGTVSRIMDFGAFVELEPGLEGLIHISEMSWAKKVRKASDAVKPGETVEVVVLGVSVGEKRISLGLKQALGDPWSEVQQKFPVGSIAEGPVISLQKFGAFIQLTEGVEGMVHVGDISADKRINHPSDELRVGQVVKAQVLEVDTAKRRVRLGMKQMVPSSLDEYIVEHKTGDVVTGRMVDVSGEWARVELGEGVQGTCKLAAAPAQEEKAQGSGKADLSSLTSMLQSRWKTGDTGASKKPSAFQAGQIRSFRISKLDPASKKIELELV
jgi:small subunit ribosomal protein S1